MSRRTERIGNAIRSVVAQAIQSRLSDPRIEPLTSITRVEVSADLTLARIYVSVMAPPARQKLCLDALRHASGRLRALVAKAVAIRQVPRLDFRLDDSVQRAFRTVQAIDAAMAELGQRPPWETDQQSAPAEGSEGKVSGPGDAGPAASGPVADERHEYGTGVQEDR